MYVKIKWNQFQHICTKGQNLKASEGEVVPSCEFVLWTCSTHTILPCPWPLCGAACRSAVCSPNVASLWRQRLRDKKKIGGREQKLVTFAKRQPDSASIPECHHQQWWDQYWVNVMDGDGVRGLTGRLTCYIKQQACLQVAGTYPWACTVLRWWHWQWRCVNPHRLGRWPPQPVAAFHVASGAVIAHWQNIPTGQTHYLRQKIWNHRTTSSAYRSTRHYLNWTGRK